MSAPGPDEAGGPNADDLGLDAAEIVRDELAQLLDRGGALTVRMASRRAACPLDLNRSGHRAG